MLIDKPRCNFKNCRYCFDGNCFSADKYENCKVTDLHSEIAKLRVDLDNAKADTLIEGKEAFLYVAKWLDKLPYAEGAIVLPCNVNDSIFVLQGKSVAEKKVERIEIHSNSLVTFAFDWRGMGYEHISINDFGKTVFLTREEAEQALKGGAE